MKAFWSAVVVAAIGFSGVWTSTAQGSTLPPNNFHRFDNVHRVANITEEQFNQVIDYIASIWAPLAEIHGAKLAVEKRWTDPTVNAYAQQIGKTWKISMFGGLARRPEITLDGFALVVCHELGHHFAGYYFYGHRDWASSEGQADYFATQVCAKEAFKYARRYNQQFRNRVPATVQQKCNAMWKSAGEQELCYRSAMAGHSLATLLGALGGNSEVDFDKPDPNKVPKSNPRHPKAQCRLDTYFQGALCPVQADPRIIPGKDHPDGNNSVAAEQAAAEYSCMSPQKFPEGLRPRCWFAPLNTAFRRF